MMSIFHFITRIVISGCLADHEDDAGGVFLAVEADGQSAPVLADVHALSEAPPRHALARVLAQLQPTHELVVADQGRRLFEAAVSSENGAGNLVETCRNEPNARFAALEL